MQSICSKSEQWSNSGQNLSRKAIGKTSRCTESQKHEDKRQRLVCLVIETWISADLFDINAREQVHDPSAAWPKGEVHELPCPCYSLGRPFQLRLIFCQAVQPCCRQTSPAQGAVEWKSSVHFGTGGGQRLLPTPDVPVPWSKGRKGKALSFSFVLSLSLTLTQAHESSYTCTTQPVIKPSD